MAKCSESFAHTDLDDGETCLGLFRRHISADFQTCAEPFHLQDGNKHYGGVRPGTRDVFSTKAQVEYIKMREKEYERKWRPSQGGLPPIQENGSSDAACP